jgi:hypothetical protein
MRCFLILGSLLLLPIAGFADSYVNIISTHNTATITYGSSGLPYETDCTVSVEETDETPVDSDISTEGLSRRTVVFTGLTASTDYQVTIDCGSDFDDAVDEPFSTTATPAGGNINVNIQSGEPSTLSNVARATVEFDDNVALSSSSTVQNTSCASGCIITISVPKGLQYYRWIWQTSGDATVALTPVYPIHTGNISALITHYLPPAPSLVVPNLAEWESQMLSYGATHCANAAAQVIADPTGGIGYGNYDGMEVWKLIGDYTGDSSWYDCIEHVRTLYRDNYVLSQPTPGAVAPWYNFTKGFRSDWERVADADSKTAAIEMSEHASFCSDAAPLAWTESAISQREIAYCLMAALNAEALGEDQRTKRNQWRDQALDHLDQLFITKDFRAPDPFSLASACAGKYYYQPFMTSLSVEALIQYWEATADDSVIATIQTALDLLWTDAWIEEDQTMWYQNCKDEPEDTWPVEGEITGLGNPAKDLNLLIAPMYEWLYQRTSTQGYRDKADALFSGGVVNAGTFLYLSKQFNQNYLRSF